MNEESIKNLLLQLVKIPSITASPNETEAADFILDYLSNLPYFLDNRDHLQTVLTPLEGSETVSLNAVVAQVRAAEATNRTILFISHFDVVDVSCFGELEPYAFDQEELKMRIKQEFMSKSDPPFDPDMFLFGRGIMDMKLGVAIELELIKAFSNNRNMFDVNLVFAFVGDEENCSAGMRGVVPSIAKLVESGLDFIAAINTEPCEPGKPGTKNPVIFLGSIGKLLPTFYVVGQNSHVGDYYHGLSAALIASNIVQLAECNPDLADPSTPSWTCLELKILKDGYNVTVPDRAAAYFNCFSTKSNPIQILEKMDKIAAEAMNMAINQTRKSYNQLKEKGYNGDINIIEFSPKVIHYDELLAKAKENDPSFDESANLSPGDVRDQGLSIIENVIKTSKIVGPVVITTFLPPFVPSRTDYIDSPRYKGMVASAVTLVEDVSNKYHMKMEIEEYFAGICDLSYTGYQGDISDLNHLQNNFPGWGTIYQIPSHDLVKLDMPVINLGPIGFDAHKKYERLETEYSLKILPGLIIDAVKLIAQNIK